MLYMGVLLFSLSISIDALGYSMGFGSKNRTLTLGNFFVLNLINTLILALFLQLFSSYEYLFKIAIISKLAPILLGIFGVYNVFISFYRVIKEIKLTKNTQQNTIKNSVNFSKFLMFNFAKKTRDNNYLILTDFLLLFLVFIFENAFSTFVFYTSFNDVLLFILSNFVFHFFFFLMGFNLGKRLAKKLKDHTNFISGYIFLWLSFIELFL